MPAPREFPLCPQGHPNLPDATTCMWCSAAIDATAAASNASGPTSPTTARPRLIDRVLNRVVDAVPASIKPQPGHAWSYDWCRFRRNSRCMYPRELNIEATKAVGYAVCIPEDRGYCPRVKWDDQKQCPVGEPGPRSGDRNALPDATIAWEDGGQRLNPTR